MGSILDFGFSILLGSVLTIIAVRSGAANHIYNMVAIALEAEYEVAFMQILFSAICGFMHILLTIVAGRSAVRKRRAVVLLDYTSKKQRRWIAKREVP